MSLKEKEKKKLKVQRRFWKKIKKMKRKCSVGQHYWVRGMRFHPRPVNVYIIQSPSHFLIPFLPHQYQKQEKICKKEQTNSYTRFPFLTHPVSLSPHTLHLTNAFNPYHTTTYLLKQFLRSYTPQTFVTCRAVRQNKGKIVFFCSFL